MNVRSACLLIVWLILPPTGFGMKVGTYNLRFDNPEDARDGNDWSQRAPVIASLIRFHDFDVLGTQEGLPNQMADLRNLLPDYACTSYGRDDGKLAGEHAGIFYKKDRFDVLTSGMFWLSQTPDLPGRGWDASLPRICTWARLREKSGGRSFCFLTVHMDHHGGESRKESSRLILRRIPELAGGDPVFLVGDFNTDQNSEAYRTLSGSGLLADSAAKAEVTYLLNGTANKFDPDSKTESRIDHVFVSPGMRVRRFGVLTDSYRIQRKTPDPRESVSANFPSAVKFKDSEARLPSDHFPILVETADP